MVRRDDGSPARVEFDPYSYPDVNEMIDNWLDISFALNNINRSMGQPDIYPFVISPVVKDKLGFVQNLLKAHAQLAAGDCARRARDSDFVTPICLGEA